MHVLCTQGTRMQCASREKNQFKSILNIFKPIFNAILNLKFVFLFVRLRRPKSAIFRSPTVNEDLKREVDRVWTRNMLIGSRVYNHALAGRAACGSYSGSERGNMLLSSAKAFASRDCAGLLPGASGILLSLTVMSCATFFASST